MIFHLSVFAIHWKMAIMDVECFFWKPQVISFMAQMLCKENITSKVNYYLFIEKGSAEWVAQIVCDLPRNMKGVRPLLRDAYIQSQLNVDFCCCCCKEWELSNGLSRTFQLIFFSTILVFRHNHTMYFSLDVASFPKSRAIYSNISYVIARLKVFVVR